MIKQKKNSKDILIIRYIVHKDAERMKFVTDVKDDEVVIVLEEFINSYNIRHIPNPQMKIFLKQFNQSLDKIKVSKKKWFSHETLSCQYIFFMKLDSRLRSERVYAGIVKLQHILIKFYRFISQKSYIHRYDLKIDSILISMMSRKNFFKIFERRYCYVNYKKWGELIKQDTMWLASNVETVLFHKDSEFMSFVVDTDNDMIVNVLDAYLNSYPLKSASAICVSIFIGKFKESLGEFEISKKKWFNEETFCQQYIYFKEAEEYLVEGKITKESKKLKEVLVNFYRFITYGEYLKLYPNNFSKIFIDKINSKSFYKMYEQNYYFVYYNQFEEVPKSDKICIIPTGKMLRNANSCNTNRVTIDVTICAVKYSDDYKNFIWSNLGNVGTLTSKSQLVNFLNFLDEKQSGNGNHIDEKVLWEYRGFIKKSIENPNSIKVIFKIIRKYLKFYKDKYQIGKTDLDIFSLAGLDRYRGGRPIDKDDINLLYEAFVQKSLEDQKYKLYVIVFEIFYTTKYRFGEIINFKRDCLIKLDDGTYMIQCIGKITDSLIKQERITPETARYIEEAMELTKGCSEYIFVEPYVATHIKKYKKINFKVEFKKILLELKGKVKNDDYCVNNIRHTHIDTVYREGIGEGKSLSEIALMLDQSFKTANKHYRAEDDLLNYLEVMNQVSISDVNIEGKVLKEQDNQNDNIVEKGAGSCNVIGCRFKIGKCLICNNFTTFANRKPIFEEKLNELDELIEEGIANRQNEEVEELQSCKKVVARYIYEIEKMLLGTERENA